MAVKGSAPPKGEPELMGALPPRIIRHAKGLGVHFGWREATGTLKFDLWLCGSCHRPCAPHKKGNSDVTSSKYLVTVLLPALSNGLLQVLDAVSLHECKTVQAHKSSITCMVPVTLAKTQRSQEEFWVFLAFLSL
ncbi:hypothetical protein TcBrA4_0048750 [Trypanosoma cruzi]|nr:hypothetical protein TcBrA4_0048750 [Trypanosoma cruzi]